MTLADMLTFYASLIETGQLDRERQIALAADLGTLAVKVRACENFCDEIVRNAAEDADLAERALAMSNVVQLPRRVVPIRLTVPPIQAIEGETWR